MTEIATYACALIVRDGKVLLGRRAHFRATYANCWDVIGGKVEAGETPEQALIRELGEEIAITPLNPVFFDRLEDRQINPAIPPTYLFFRVEDWTGGEPVINNHEHSHLEWFTLQQACDLRNLVMPDYPALFARVLGQEAALG